MIPENKLRVCAVSYLNTVPLVWGMLHGEQRGLFQLSFSIPAECADRLQTGQADIGIVPCIELARQDLTVIPGAGIACRGPVRSILLISKVPYSQIETLAVDASSRTSVMLARIVLHRRYGSDPDVVARPPDLASMLAGSDACLIIGDPALLLDPETLPFRVLDLGAEWTEMTGYPMVFAVWAARPGVPAPDPAPFLRSLQFGKDNVSDIAALEHGKRGITAELALNYLSRSIVYDLGPREYDGMNLFLEYARQLKPVEQSRILAL